MTILATPRSRILTVRVTFTFASLSLLLFARQVVVRAAPPSAIESFSNGPIGASLVSDQAVSDTRAPVLVELFTSEGCSSCPPADTLLARLLREQPVKSAEIIVLEEHVDYWESLGWHDRFSSHQLTERQNEYSRRMQLDGVYTPQMVVDGTAQFVGNDSAHALRAIAQAAQVPKLPLRLTSLQLEGERIAGSVSGPASANLPKADLYAVLVEKMASTNVLRGENGGRSLNHVSVVRALQTIGSLQAAGRAPLPFTFSLPQSSSLANLRVVVFAQRPEQGAIVGAISSPVFAEPASPVTISAAR